MTRRFNRPPRPLKWRGGGAQMQPQQWWNDIAVVRWSIDDVKSLDPRLTDAEATALLTENEEAIKDAMVEAGWEVLRDIVRHPGAFPAQRPETFLNIVEGMERLPEDDIDPRPDFPLDESD